MVDLSFYEVSAQVIPVLILALVIQERTERAAADRSPPIELFLLGCVVLAAVGEIISLSALLEGEAPADPGKYAVLAGVTVPFLPFLMRLAGPSVETIGAAYPPLRPIGRFLSWTLPFALLVLAFTGLDAAPIFAGFALVLYIALTVAATFLKPKPREADPTPAPEGECRDADE